MWTTSRRRCKRGWLECERCRVREHPDASPAGCALLALGSAVCSPFPNVVPIHSAQFRQDHRKCSAGDKADNAVSDECLGSFAFCLHFLLLFKQPTPPCTRQQFSVCSPLVLHLCRHGARASGSTAVADLGGAADHDLSALNGALIDKCYRWRARMTEQRNGATEKTCVYAATRQHLR